MKMETRRRSQVAYDYIAPQGFINAPKSYFISSHNPHHRGYDLVLRQDDTQTLRGQFMYGDMFKTLPCEKIAIYVYSFPGSITNLPGATPEKWKLYLKDLLTDGNGNIVWTVPPESRLGKGLHLVRFYVQGDGTWADTYVNIIDSIEKCIVTDIDGTMTTSNMEMIREIISNLWDQAYNAEMYPGAAELTRWYADQGYRVVYLTARLPQLGGATVKWLKGNGFPFGIVHTSESITNMTNTGDFKLNYLQLLDSKGEHFERGYGNAQTDIDAYYGYNLPDSMTFIIGSEAGSRGTYAIDNYVDHLLDMKNKPPHITSRTVDTAITMIQYTYNATATDDPGQTVSFTFKNVPSWLSISGSGLSGKPPTGAMDTSFILTASDYGRRNNGNFAKYETVLVSIHVKPNDRRKKTLVTEKIPKTYSFESGIQGLSSGKLYFVWKLPEQSRIKLEVWNTKGKLIARLAEGIQRANSYAADFDLPLGAGLYICKFETVSTVNPIHRLSATKRLWFLR